MKKNRLFSFVLTLCLISGLFAPFSLVGAEDMSIAGTAAILVDTTYGEILYEQNAHEKRFPASITKVMTALLVIEAVVRGEFSLDQLITASDTVNDKMIAGASTQNIRPGEIMPLRDVLACALIPSANEACNILAETIGGSLSGFVELMNQRAVELGCKNTNFENPHGLHSANHYTTAYDIYLVCNEAMKQPLFREMVSSKSYEVAATNMTGIRTLHDTNALLSNFNRVGYLYSYATGMKTGYTPEAGHCLAASASKENRSLISVVLGCEREAGATGSAGYTYFTESRKLLDWGFNNFSRRTIIDGTNPLLTVPVTLSEEADKVVAEPRGSIEATIPTDWKMEDFTRTIENLYPEGLPAPIEKGQLLGKVTLSYDGKSYGSLDLVAVAPVERSELLYTLHRIQIFFGQTWVRLLLVFLLLLVLVLVLRFLVFGKRRSGGGRRNYAGRRR